MILRADELAVHDLFAQRQISPIVPGPVVGVHAQPVLIDTVARRADSRVITTTPSRRCGIATTPSRRPRHARSIAVARIGPNGLKFEKETTHDLV